MKRRRRGESGGLEARALLMIGRTGDELFDRETNAPFFEQRSAVADDAESDAGVQLDRDTDSRLD